MLKQIKNNYQKGGISFEMEVVIFIVILFIIWVLTNGTTHPESQKPFIKPLTDPTAPGQVYGKIGY